MRKLAWIAALAVTGCSGTDPFNAGLACTAQLVPGITVTTLDAATGKPVTTRGTVVAQDGSYSDTAKVVSIPPNYALAYERAGTYTVTVEAPGYLPFRLDGVAVSKDECHVQTVSVTALLSR
jgi:hypothetical protein